MVVLDDVGWAGLKGYNGGVSGDQYPYTPHMEGAMKRGIKLTNMYVQPMCSPTRAAMMTGRLPHRFGGQTFVQRPFQPTWMPKDETTLANKMKQLGYKTSLIGKWHLGYGKVEFTPCERGFDSFYGSYEVGGHHYDHTVGPGSHALGDLFTLNEGHGQTLDLHRSTSTDGGMKRSTHEYVVNQRGTYSSEMWSKEASRQIYEHAAMASGVPLFMYVAFTTIHTPLMVDERYISMNQHMKGDDEIRINAGMMTATDEGYGEIVRSLQETKLWSNTIIVCFSDNGAMVSQGASSFPLRGQKMGPFEGGIRSVAFVSGGHSDITKFSGTTSNAMLHAVDIHTLTLHWAAPVVGGGGGSSGGGEGSGGSHHDGIAGYTNPGSPKKKLDAVEGSQLWSAIIGERRTSPRTSFVALLDDLGAYPAINKMSGNTLLGACSAVRMGKWKLVEGAPGRDDWYPVDVSKCFPKLAHEGSLSIPPLLHPECPRGDFQYDLIGQVGKMGTPGTEGIRLDGGAFVPKSLWLFDIESDPSERHDVSASNPEVVRKLRSEIERHRKESVPPFPDRWASFTAMMEGNFHVLAPGNGYEAALTSWMEEDHLRSISFYRRARSWIRMKFINLATKMTGVGQVHREDTSSSFSSSSSSSSSSANSLHVERMDAAVRMALGKAPGEMFTKAELLELQQNLFEMEREGSGGRFQSKM